MSPDEARNRDAILRADIALSHFSGPLPPPEQLAKYEHILPGAADRIIRMAEQQATHRQFQEGAVIHSGIAAQRAGIACAFILAMTAIVGGVWLSSKGMSAAGLTSIIAALGSLVGVFIYRTSEQKKELRRKSDSIDRSIRD